MPIIQMICFANSRKLSGRCVAGIAISGFVRGWIRPVSALVHGELTHEFLYGSPPREVKLLDVIELSVLQPRRLGCHSEDFVVDSTVPWKVIGSISLSEAAGFAENHPPILWVNGNHTSNGFNDQIAESEAAALPNSLRLIAPNISISEARLMQGMGTCASEVNFAWKNSVIFFGLRILELKESLVVNLLNRTAS